MTLANACIALNMQVFVQVGAEGSEQLVLLGAQPALAMPGRDYLLAERIIGLEVADFILDVPFATGQQIVPSLYFLLQQKAQLQAFDHIEAEIQLPLIEQPLRFREQGHTGRMAGIDCPVNQFGQHFFSTIGAQLAFGHLRQVLDHQHRRQFGLTQGYKRIDTLAAQQTRTGVLGDRQEYGAG